MALPNRKKLTAVLALQAGLTDHAIADTTAGIETLKQQADHADHPVFALGGGVTKCHSQLGQPFVFS